MSLWIVWRKLSCGWSISAMVWSRAKAREAAGHFRQKNYPVRITREELEVPRD